MRRPLGELERARNPILRLRGLTCGCKVLLGTYSTSNLDTKKLYETLPIKEPGYYIISSVRVATPCFVGSKKKGFKGRTKSPCISLSANQLCRPTFRSKTDICVPTSRGKVRRLLLPPHLRTFWLTPQDQSSSALFE